MAAAFIIKSFTETFTSILFLNLSRLSIIQFVEPYVCGMLALDSASLLAIVRRMLVWGTSVYSDPCLAPKVGFGDTGLVSEKQEKYTASVSHYWHVF